MSVARLSNESGAYTAARQALWAAEVALKEQRERVAELRRALPLDTVAPNYALTALSLAGRDDESPREAVLSDLFEDSTQPLLLMHFMFGKKQTDPCPMCSMWADGYRGITKHLRRRVNFALAVAGDVLDFRTFARARGWDTFQVVSTARCTMKADLKLEDEEGSQLPGVSVFVKRGDEIRHAYTASAIMGGGHYRGLDLLSPVWNFFDLTPGGRGDWMPTL